MERRSSITKIDIESLTNLDDEKLCSEFDSYCPVLSVALRAAAGDFLKPGSNNFGHRLQFFSILFKARYGHSRASVIAHRNDQLLIAAKTRKKAFGWFNMMGFSNSYKTALRMNKSLAADFDSKVLSWKEFVEKGASVEYPV